MCSICGGEAPWLEKIALPACAPLAAREPCQAVKQDNLTVCQATVLPLLADYLNPTPWHLSVKRFWHPWCWRPGLPPDAVMNPVYSGIRLEPVGAGSAGMYVLFAPWPNRQGSHPLIFRTGPVSAQRSTGWVLCLPRPHDHPGRLPSEQLIRPRSGTRAARRSHPRCAAGARRRWPDRPTG